MPSLFPDDFRRPVRLLIATLVLCLSGCFVAKYEERLKITRELYEHVNALNNNLSRDWFQAPGLILRVPQQFVPIAAPVAPTVVDSEGEAVASTAPVVDERQPAYLNLELPGLVGAWKATFRVLEGHTYVSRVGYMYVLSNDSLFQVPESEPERIDPKNYTEHITKLLESTLQVHPDESAFVLEKFPRAPRYIGDPYGSNLVPKVGFTAVTLQPAMQIEGASYKFPVFFHGKGALQVILIFVIPEGVEPAEMLPERIDLCLETLKTSDAGSGVGAIAAPVGGAPPSSGPGF